LCGARVVKLKYTSFSVKVLLSPLILTVYNDASWYIIYYLIGGQCRFNIKYLCLFAHVGVHDVSKR